MLRNQLKCPVLAAGKEPFPSCNDCTFLVFGFQEKVESYPKTVGVGAAPEPESDGRALNKTLKIHQWCPHLIFSDQFVEINILVDGFETMLQILSDTIDQQACFKMVLQGACLTVTLMAPPSPDMYQEVLELYADKVPVKRESN